MLELRALEPRGVTQSELGSRVRLAPSSEQGGGRGGRRVGSPGRFKSLGIGSAGGSALLLVSLLASLIVWYRAQGSVAVSTVSSQRTEAFYWVTIMFSQTLGTALGDWVADSAAMGYRGGALIFGGLLLVVVALFLWTTVSRTVLFRVAFVLTRPLGAVLGDLLDKPSSAGGLDLSRLGASAPLVAFIVVLVRVFPWRAAGAEP